MKIKIAFLKNLCFVSICGICLVACKSKDPDLNPGPEKGDTITAQSPDTIAAHFKFLNAKKVNGSIPESPSGGSALKFSIKDTLRLVPGIYIPVSFLHDKTSNVSGVFIQVAGNANDASFYYDVPELSDINDVDTVSVIMVQYNPTDVSGNLPIAFEIKITPYGKTGQPIDETKVPVKVEKLNDDIPGNTKSSLMKQQVATGDCGLTGGYWIWRASYTLSSRNNGSFDFYNDPYKVWGKTGQEIKGSCCNGTSIYGPCPGAGNEPNTSLLFYTYSQYKKETFVFYDNSFTRTTVHATAIPLPVETDFCNDATGLVDEVTSIVDYKGDLTITEVSVPDRLRAYYEKRNKLILGQTSSNPASSGYGNPGGIIHELTCDILVLIQLDPEGGSMDLYKIYYHTYFGVTQEWFTLHVMG